jgi:predicted metal-binding membrane protein
VATARRVRDGTRSLTITAALVALAAIAWALTAGRMSGMDMGPGTELGALGWFAVSWALMMAAMMLPSLAPVANGSRAPGAFAGGYLAVWVGAGLVAYAAVEAVRSLELGWLGWDRGGRWVAAAVVLAAGVYQLTRAKNRCLEHCRMGPVERRARSGASAALATGMRHGVSCLGCCAAMMAALFALGVMSLTWMAAVAALIAAERLLPWRTIAVYGVAAAFVVLAVWMAVAPDALPGFTVPASMGGM